MTKHLPEWIMERYSKLWLKFKDKEFTKGQAEKIIGEDKALAVFLSELRKSGWIIVRLDEEDARKSIYKLKNPTIGILEEIKELSKNGNKKT